MVRFAILNRYITISLIISPIQLSSVSFQHSDKQFFGPVGPKIDLNSTFSLKKTKSVLCENMTFLNIFPHVLFDTPSVCHRYIHTLMKRNIDT